MRMLPSRAYAEQPAMSKRRAAGKIKHISAPLKGLSLSSAMTTGDPLTAPILDNFNVEEDRISCRAGSRLTYTHPAGLPIWCLIPYYGGINKLAAASNGEIFVNATVIKSGFLSNDWHWSSFSNLSSNEYTVLVNGVDGVWSWDGGDISTPGAQITVTSLTSANPAVVTVAAGDAAKFSNGQTVVISGAVGAGFENANGQWIVINKSGSSFAL